MTNLLRKYNFKIIILIFLLLTFFQPTSDLDLGWHLRYGEHFFQNWSVLKENILSNLWPDYKWVQASWGYDLILYLIFSKFSFLGVSVISAIISMAVFLVVTYPIKRFSVFQFLFLSVVFITQSFSLYGESFRSQSLSALIFAVCLVVVHRAIKDHKYKLFYSLPALFLIWANLHGGFSLGLIVFVIMYFSYFFLFLIKKFTQKAMFIPFGISLLFSFLTPLVNPWGARIYEETFKHSSNPSLEMILEWMPLIQWKGAAILAFLVLCLVSFVFVKKRVISDLPFFISFLFITFLSFSAIRFLILFSIMSVFYLAQNIGVLNLRFLKNRTLNFSLKIIFIAIILYDIFIGRAYLSSPLNFLANPSVLLNQSWNSYCSLAQRCSEKITEVMLKNPPLGVGFHPYEYGGYMSWRVPNVKTFVDGRMSAWEKNGEFPPIAETLEAHSSKNPLSFIKLDKKYQFQWAIVPKYTSLSEYLMSLSKLGDWKIESEDELYIYFTK